MFPICKCTQSFLEALWEGRWIASSSIYSRLLGTHCQSFWREYGVRTGCAKASTLLWLRELGWEVRMSEWKSVYRSFYISRWLRSLFETFLPSPTTSKQVFVQYFQSLSFSFRFTTLFFASSKFSFIQLVYHLNSLWIFFYPLIIKFLHFLQIQIQIQNLNQDVFH